MSFDVMTSLSSTKMLTSAIHYGTALDETYNGKLTHVDTELCDTWQTVTMTFGVAETHHAQKNPSLIIYDRDKTLDDFSVRNIMLTKNDDVVEAYKVTWNLEGRQINEMWVSGQVPQVDFDTANGVNVFTGWDSPITAVTADVTYTAQYVSAGLHLVGAQVRISDNAVRLVGKIDDYQLEGLEKLGFEILINGISNKSMIPLKSSSFPIGN